MEHCVINGKPLIQILFLSLFLTMPLVSRAASEPENVRVTSVDKLIFSDNRNLNRYMPEGNLVENRKMASALAEIYIRNIYGDDGANEKPYIVEDFTTEWEVSGSLPRPDMSGGVFTMVINKKYGQVLNVSHTK